MDKKWKTRVQWSMIGLVAVALIQELLKGAGRRDWHGKVLRLVPYDFRFPTLERVKSTYWNADNPALLTGQVFGVGWTVNFRSLVKLVTGR